MSQIVIKDSMEPNFFFCSFKGKNLFVHNQHNTVVANIVVPIQGNNVIVGADTSGVGQYITVTANNHKVYVYRKMGSNSWSLTNVYGI